MYRWSVTGTEPARQYQQTYGCSGSGASSLYHGDDQFHPHMDAFNAGI